MATVLAGVGLLLVAVEAVLVLSNQASTSRLAMQRAYIKQTPQLARATQVVASAIAGSAASDETLRDLLMRNGFKIETNPVSGPAVK